MKKLIWYLFKCAIAGIIAVVILSLFSLVYYNPPIATVQADGTTNYKFEKSSRWSFMLEGFGFGKSDTLGYNNAYYDDLQQPDIVVVGSSHMEALQVPQDANCVYLLNERFSTDDLTYNDFKCFNLGISGHFFEVSASNFKSIAEKYKGADYIVLEVTSIEYSPSVLDDILDEKCYAPIEKKSAIAEAAQRIPYVRLLYKKLNEAKSAKVTPAPSVKEEVNIDTYVEKMSAVLEKIAQVSKDNDIETVILMHERFWQDEDGNIVTELNETYKEAFEKCCEANGIRIIDATPTMIDAYKESFDYSYGFSNSTPGEGHLNKTGHKIVADVIYKAINEMEASK